MVVSVSDIRTCLNDISVDKISDTVIQQKINFATAKINTIKKSSATTSDIDNAIINLAAFYTYSVYADNYRNLPAVTFNNGYAFPADGSNLDMAIAISVKEKLDNIRLMAEEFLGIISDIRVYLRPDENKMLIGYMTTTYTHEYIARTNNSARLWLGL